ncbi:MAG: hypothetical protein EU532_02295 [Promethearchaeota archaeon]|nr:MAG: hypothetical protein EU532_02295 [Candidatus Lokiarchaeota archaeon]
MHFPISQLNTIFDSSKLIRGIISIWGDFGIGKTTLALQSAINTAKFNKVIFIYTKPDLPYEKIGKFLEDDNSDVLNNILFISTPDFLDLNKIVLNLEFLILHYLREQNIALKLIVVDSITDLYRLELNREKKEKNVTLNYQLNQLLANLNYINEKYVIEVLIVNELSRRNYEDSIKEVQSGGKVMDYWIDYSIKISRTKKLNTRNIVLTKHPEMKNHQFLCNITENGFK